MPPKADDPWLDPNFLGDRPRAAPRRRQKNYPRPLQIALQSHRGATARLKHLAICPRKVDFSCFGYHPYLESRLTIQEKWVLSYPSRPMRAVLIVVGSAILLEILQLLTPDRHARVIDAMIKVAGAASGITLAHWHSILGKQN
jgi:hypothetical protein